MHEGPLSTVIGASWAAAGKWAVRESGDAVSVVQCHSGRVVALIVDVQGGGGGAARTAWSLVALGSQLATDGTDAATVAAVLNRALWTRRSGRVQADIGVLIGEAGFGMSVATYGSLQAGFPRRADRWEIHHAEPAGLRRDAEPTNVAIDITDGALVMCSDGLASSSDELLALCELDSSSPLTASTLLARAVARDYGRPRNDMSVVVMTASLSSHPKPSISGEIRVAQRLAPTRGAANDADTPEG